MSIRKHVRPGRSVVLGIALMAVVALFFAWGHGAGKQVAADETPVPAAGMDFSMAVEDVEGCDTTGGDTKCYIEPGSTFTIGVYLNSLPDKVSEYEAFDIFVTYTGVSSEDNLAEVWPECGFPAAWYDAGEVGFGCAIGIDGGPSTYTGLMVTNDFNCDANGAITLVHGESDTSIIGEALTAYAEGEGTTETLTINCGEEPPPTEEPTEPTEPSASPTPAGELPPTGTAGGVDANGGVSAGLWVIIGALLAAGAAGLALFGWRYARSRSDTLRPE